MKTTTKASQKREQLIEAAEYLEYDLSDISSYLTSVAGCEVTVYIDCEDWHHCYIQTEEGLTVVFERASDWSDRVVHAVVSSDLFNKTIIKASNRLEQVKLYGMLAQQVSADCYVFPY